MSLKIGKNQRKKSTFKDSSPDFERGFEEGIIFDERGVEESFEFGSSIFF
jgi:hypothetical protein